MGGKSSKPVISAAAAVKEPLPGSAGSSSAPQYEPEEDFEWGNPPEAPPDDEMNPDDLVLQTWASCKARPNPAKLYRSDTEERHRREQMKWRKRLSFVELDCGDDAFFVSNTYNTIGVADGVGGWREEGYDPAAFANVMMRNAKHFTETHRTSVEPEFIATQAYRKLMHDGEVAAGSSTALIASLRKMPDGKHLLDVANLGDGGLIVIRDQNVISRCHEKVHGFNLPFQLAKVPRNFKHECIADSMSDAVRESFEVKDGDVVVMGTDGLFDNRFASQIAADAAWIGATTKSVYDGVPLIGGILTRVFGQDHGLEFTDPYRVAQRICNEAYKASASKTLDTPWSRSLKDFGVESPGGKIDDITVLVTRITTREKAQRLTLW